ncbi:MAG: ABC transporter substrate-binding protein, partial [Alphaproteobacteria bacterium]
MRAAARWAAGAVAALAFGAGPGAALELIETPAFEEAVAAGELPPVAERAPQEPRIITFDDGATTPGRHGGDLRMLVGRAKDVRLLVVYGYARLVGYDLDYAIKPDILAAVEVADGRAFTLKLRKGHRWSDGHPFTAEDFRYWWEDVANNPELAPSGPPKDMLIGGAAPTFEVIDETTVRYTWPTP